MTTRIARQIPLDYAGWRLDQTLAELLPDFSRARLQQWIKTGQLRLDDKIVRPRERVLGGEWVRGECTPEVETTAQPQAIALDIRYQDEQIIVLNKPAGLVVHPAAGNHDGTLLNALLHYAPELETVPRAGIVHRLDKDTSGLLVVARTLTAHKALVEQLQARSVKREYLAVAVGAVTAGATIEAPIGRHPVDRKRMAVVANGKPATTHYRIAERFRAHTLLTVQLETGRTHQIRVHLAHKHYPLLGDPVYGGRLRVPAGASAALIQQLQHFQRQALHAARLGLLHPATARAMSWQSDPPDDMQALLACLRQDTEEGQQQLS